jgi:hypothetical protein
MPHRLRHDALGSKKECDKNESMKARSLRMTDFLTDGGKGPVRIGQDPRGIF